MKKPALLFILSKGTVKDLIWCECIFLPYLERCFCHLFLFLGLCQTSGICVVIFKFHWNVHFKTELSVCRPIITHSDTNGWGDKIWAIPMAGYHVTVTSAEFVSCSQPWIGLLLLVGTDVNMIRMMLQLWYHITYTGKNQLSYFHSSCKIQTCPPIVCYWATVSQIALL